MLKGFCDIIIVEPCSILYNIYYIAHCCLNVCWCFVYIYSYSEVDHKSFKTRRSPENLTFKERQQLFSLAMVT